MMAPSYQAREGVVISNSIQSSVLECNVISNSIQSSVLECNVDNPLDFGNRLKWNSTTVYLKAREQVEKYKADSEAIQQAAEAKMAEAEKAIQMRAGLEQKIADGEKAVADKQKELGDTEKKLADTEKAKTEAEKLAEAYAQRMVKVAAFWKRSKVKKQLADEAAARAKKKAAA